MPRKSILLIVVVIIAAAVVVWLWQGDIIGAGTCKKCEHHRDTKPQCSPDDKGQERCDPTGQYVQACYCDNCSGCSGLPELVCWWTNKLCSAGCKTYTTTTASGATTTSARCKTLLPVCEDLSTSGRGDSECNKRADCCQYDPAWWPTGEKCTKKGMSCGNYTPLGKDACQTCGSNCQWVGDVCVPSGSACAGKKKADCHNGCCWLEGLGCPSGCIEKKTMSVCCIDCDDGIVTNALQGKSSCSCGLYTTPCNAPYDAKEIVEGAACSDSLVDKHCITT